MSTLKLHLKVQRCLHQTTFETLKYLQQTMFWNYWFTLKCKKFADAKSGPKCLHFFGLLHLFKKSQCAYNSSPTGKKSPNIVTQCQEISSQMCIPNKVTKTKAFLMFHNFIVYHWTLLNHLNTFKCPTCHWFTTFALGIRMCGLGLGEDTNETETREY